MSKFHYKNQEWRTDERAEDIVVKKRKNDKQFGIIAIPIGLAVMAVAVYLLMSASDIKKTYIKVEGVITDVKIEKLTESSTGYSKVAYVDFVTKEGNEITTRAEYNSKSNPHAIGKERQRNAGLE